VTRRDDEVSAPFGDVDRYLPRHLDGIDENLRASVVCDVDDFGDAQLGTVRPRE